MRRGGYGLRLVGPNCLGVMAPHARLNASFAANAPAPGDLALISQSGAVAAGLVEWSVRRRIGLSAVVSLGDQADVDFADCLDYFAADRMTRAILLYVESIGGARKFMSAARAAARIKPIVVIKSGRHERGARAAATHTGALAGTDAVYDAAFRGAGLLRVLDLDELFAAAETLGREKPFAGERLAIVTNGGGIGVLAVDRLVDLGGTLAGLSEATLAQLDRTLPPTWSRGNPVDIIGDAGPDRYAGALGALLADPDNDAVLALNVPTALASAAAAAEAVVATVAQHRESGGRRKPVFAVWLAERAGGARLRSGAHPAFRHRGGSRARVHASRPLPGGAGRSHGDPRQPARRFRARREGRPAGRRRGPRRRPAVARSPAGARALAGLRHPGGAGGPGARCR